MNNNILKPKEEKYDVGVTVARFQVPQLHDGHLQLLNSILHRHGRMIVVLGGTAEISENNPLSFKMRREMVEETFPSKPVVVTHIEDIPGDNKKWSDLLNSKIKQLLLPGETACLYGSRDSFLSGYVVPMFPTVELDPEININGTLIRKKCLNYPGSPDFRAGVIHTVLTHFSNKDSDIVACERYYIVRKKDGKKYEILMCFNDSKGLMFPPRICIPRHVFDTFITSPDMRKSYPRSYFDIENIYGIHDLGVVPYSDNKYTGYVTEVLIECGWGSGRPDIEDPLIEYTKWIPLTRDTVEVGCDILKKICAILEISE